MEVVTEVDVVFCLAVADEGEELGGHYGGVSSVGGR